MAGKSPTQRTTALLKAEGAYYDIVETFNHMTMRRKDVLGFIDILTFDALGRCVGLQVTGSGGTSSRRKKIIHERRKQAMLWLQAGNLIVIHDWVKRKKKRGGKQMIYKCNVTRVTLADFIPELKGGVFG